MASVVFPAAKKSSTADLIMRILAEEADLTVKQIYGRIGKTGYSNISYQAVHKAVNEMVKQKALLKMNKKYSLNKKWLKSMVQQLSSLERAPDRQGEYGLLFKNRCMNLHFTKLIDVARFIIYDLAKLPNQTKTAIICHWRHMYATIGLSESEFEDLKSLLGKAELYVLCKYDTLFDRALAETAGKIGMRVLLDQDVSSENDLIVSGDYLIQIYYPENLRQSWHEDYAKIKQLIGLDVNALLENITQKRWDINVVITKNQKIAKQIREESLSKFKP